jgi:hypothetical protein
MDRAGGISCSTDRNSARRTLMNLALWIAAGLLAVVALVGGVSKTFVPKEKLAKAPGGGWTDHAGVGFVKTLGVLELLARHQVLSHRVGPLASSAGGPNQYFNGSGS